MTRVVIKSESGDAKKAAAAASKEENWHRKTPSIATTEAALGSASVSASVLQGDYSLPRTILEQNREVVEL
jgi:hypothetical protein